MKWMHLADLHLGKILNEFDLEKDQQAILDDIVRIADREEVDAVLIAGDIYQRSQPSNEAIAMFDRFLTRVAKNRKVLIISGNHDASEKISYLSEMLENAGIYVSRAFQGTLQSYAFQDEYGEIDFHLLPFLRPFQVKRFYPEEEITNSQQAIEAVLRHSAVDWSKRNVILCHQFIISAERCDSEELELGTLDNVSASVFDRFDYVALGHIHKPQKLGRESMRYAGSPLKYSFSEMNHPKSVPIVELKEKGQMEIRLIPLIPRHELRKEEGFLEELLKKPSSEDYLWIVLHDEIVDVDARVRLQRHFPNMMQYTIENAKTQETVEIRGLEQIEELTPEEIFAEFYRQRRGGVPMSEEHQRLLARILAEEGGENA